MIPRWAAGPGRPPSPGSVVRPEVAHDPLVLLTLVSFAVFLWPLAADVASAAFFAIPWGLRWTLGQAAIVAGGLAAGVGRRAGSGPRTPGRRGCRRMDR